MTAPKHLSAESKRVYRKIAEEYELKEDSALILRAALENWDRSQRAREEIAAGKSMLMDGKKHPLIDAEKQAYSLFLRAFAQLQLGIAPPAAPGAPLKQFR